MNFIVASLLAFSMAMGATQAMGGPSDAMGFLSSILGGNEDCPDPSIFLTKLTEATCCQEGCAAHVSTCMEELRPPNMEPCFLMKECKPSRREILRVLREEKEPQQFVMGMIAECTERLKFESISVEYIADNPKQNELNYLNGIITAENMAVYGQALIDAVEMDKCVPPNYGSFTIASKIGYHVCLLKTCADSKAAAAETVPAQTVN
ncbi:uncharacterized protein [Palaemon carinicauda]|uniref:uncharacterized protein n=1 Tax=Palaemon carinicauda TaxID=392227 RepID=UPI0035B63702